MSEYTIEVGENEKEKTCHCCSKASSVGHGFVYKNKDAYAVYYAAWSNHHEEPIVKFAVAIGEWDDDSTINDRTCFGIEAHPTKSELQFKISEPEDSPWPTSELLGPMQRREEALQHSNLRDAFAIVENICRDHNTIKAYLGIRS